MDGWMDRWMDRWMDGWIQTSRSPTSGKQMSAETSRCSTMCLCCSLREGAGGGEREKGREIEKEREKKGYGKRISFSLPESTRGEKGGGR
jgi:hypothetical protein